MNITKIELKNFKGVKSAVYELKNGLNKISGKNGEGKTTILSAILFVFVDKDYSLSKSVAAPIGNELSDTEVIITAEIDGREHTFKKIQRRKAKGETFSTSNDYELDMIPMTEKRFKESLTDMEISNLFLACCHPEYFFNETTDGKREILINMVQGHTDIEIAKTLEFEELAKELENISATDLKAKATGMKKDFEKQAGKDFSVINAKLEILEMLKAQFAQAKVSKNVLNYIADHIKNLTTLRKHIVQNIANCEKTLVQLKEVEMERVRLCEEEINSHFDSVNFKLWFSTQTGELKPCCKPIIDNYIIGESANTAREIKSKLEIMNGIQKFYNVEYPILLDGAEALDSSTLKTIKCDRQMIMASVSNRALKIN